MIATAKIITDKMTNHLCGAGIGWVGGCIGSGVGGVGAIGGVATWLSTSGTGESGVLFSSMIRLSTIGVVVSSQK